MRYFLYGFSHLLYGSMARNKISYSKHTGSMNQLLNQPDNLLVFQLDQRSPLVEGMLNLDLELLVLDLDLPLPLLLSLLLSYDWLWRSYFRCDYCWIWVWIWNYPKVSYRVWVFILSCWTWKVSWSRWWCCFWFSRWKGCL
jgi:hypothetical protein